MKCHIFFMLLLILTKESECSSDNGFFISAPGVFHVGVNEKVFVQMGKSHLNQTVSLHLEHKTGIVSAKKTVVCATEGEIKTVELMIDMEHMSSFSQHRDRMHLMLVAESPSFLHRKQTRVLVSNHRGNIFIQTDQPIYNPTQTVNYRIFTLDHTFRPHEGVFQISIYNAGGKRVFNSLKIAKGGIFKDIFHIPDVSKMGTWKITAHYEDDEANAASREFKVQKFVLPSFEVNIAMTQRYILLNAEQFDFTISAKYSHGENVKGAYHCQFGVVEKGRGKTTKPVFIPGVALTDSVENGTAAASLRIADLNMHLQKKNNETLSDLQKRGSQIYLGVFVTNIQSGEIQEAEVYLPVISHKYTIDLSRTRSFFLPEYPLDVVVVVRLPDGSPAAGVPVKIDVPVSSDKSWQGTTDQEGAVFTVFNIGTTAQITVEVSADGLQQRKVIQRASSPSNSYLYLSITNKMYSVGDSLTVVYNTNGQKDGFIYYMVLSRGILIKKGSLRMHTTVSRDNLQITPDMVPSFRLIGYYYDQHGNIIADSVWVDVRDECGVNVKVEQKAAFVPGKHAELRFDLHGQNARVALLAVDKAIYALKADNRLTAKQVFSSMESNDLGCSYSGGSDPASVLIEAGLSFVSQSQSKWKRELGCDSQSARQRRSVDLQQEMITLQSNFTDEKLKECCVHGFSLIPMRRTCQERAQRVSLVEANSSCADAFLKCCFEGERLRQQKIQEDAQKGLGRTASTAIIEQFFLDTAAQYIRRYFPTSFAFTEFDVNGKGRYSFAVPDSITTWEIQVVTLSAATGFCVVKPSEFRAFKDVFVSLKLPYSVKKYEQLSIAPVIYNYGSSELQVAVHMEQTEGLCSPSSASTTSFVNITVEPQSSQFVSFSAVPMVTGSIPIKIRLYDMEKDWGIDAIEKTLNVLTEGLQQREEETLVFKLDGTNTKNFTLDGSLPNDIVPDSISNIYISVEGDGFGRSHARNLLSFEKVAGLIVLPTGCLEQTMVRLAPTVSALRYLDLSDQWFDLPAGTRDDALKIIEKGCMRILTFRKRNGSYGAWGSVPSSTWVTALVVKVLSLVAERQTVDFGQQGKMAKVVTEKEISHTVRHLLTVQQPDGSFSDKQPVLHRGVLKGIDQEAFMTAFITLALQRSLQFLETEMRNYAGKTISKSIAYLLSHFEELQHPYAVAITAYCLSVCQPEGTDLSSVWSKLEGLATEGKNGCYLWTTNDSPENQKFADVITVETTAYALLTAVELGHITWADKTVCWLTTQENYFGGFKSSQDTIMALEALAEYELKRSVSPEANLIAEFSVPGKSDIVKLELEKKKDRVETDLKKLKGNNIVVQLTGKGDVKLKVLKAYHLLEPKNDCNQVSISVTVEGKVKYTAKVIENYEYYDDYGNNEDIETRVPRSAIEWFDARTRNRRDLDNNLNSDKTVTYRICVSHSQNRKLTGMAIADITLLSGFEALTTDLDKLKQQPEQYIAHYEASYGRVLLYFNELFEREECISFDAIQRVPIGLLQPAPAVFYDYYEPSIKCTVFYSAPQRSKMVSKLCSEDVCQCAERPCHKIQDTFQTRPQSITKSVRLQHACFSLQHACFFPTVDYAYLVEVVSVSTKSNFELYKMNVKDVLRSNGDFLVGEDSVRVFAKRRQCKGQLDLGKQYLIMGKDGSTTDSNGMMQYLLESNTWVERMPSEKECKKTLQKQACNGFFSFTDEYKIDGCRQ
ncbi:LOW QUALITY PROTEIN: complement C4-B [Morone saxatilis]|uniref:LOW QUALITY PROTEIN: complement C4-B n=1 Tax=Morone saxatilis TaxID=34816 RepID=UPI0015E2044C|nr:LOW QUALITY PROTEIN: complement C4-B [Morone saxatilis]